MKKEDIVSGATYQGASGQQKTVTRIEDHGGGKQTVHFKVVKAGTGKGNHAPAGKAGQAGASPFATWAVKKV